MSSMDAPLFECEVVEAGVEGRRSGYFKGMVSGMFAPKDSPPGVSPLPSKTSETLLSASHPQASTDPCLLA